MVKGFGFHSKRGWMKKESVKLLNSEVNLIPRDLLNWYLVFNL